MSIWAAFIAGMRVAYIQTHITNVQLITASTGEIIPWSYMLFLPPGWVLGCGLERVDYEAEAFETRFQ